MRLSTPRKLTRFYVINPITDRRFEQRFESRQDVQIRFENSGHAVQAVACDVSKRGLRLETEIKLEPGRDIQVVFPDSPDHIRCFGHVVWSRPLEEGSNYESGISIDAWYGIVQGEDSWKRYRGIRPKHDRRQRPR